MYTDVLRLIHILATAILVLLAGRLQEICWSILRELQR
jgi:hypothetical protein